MKLYTAKGAAAEISKRKKISVESVRRYLREDRLDGKVFGRDWIITESALKKFMEAYIK